VQTSTVDGSAQLDTSNPFFQSLGANGRTCNTCHQEGGGWSISAADVQTRFTNSNGTDPIFQAVDGANCDHDAAGNPVDLSTPAARTSAFTLLTQRGLIRIFLPVPANAEFTVVGVSNQYSCNETTTLSVYRRPLPSANLRFTTNLMWDGRESSILTGTQDITPQTNPGDLLADLAHLSIDATRIHAESLVDPSADQQQAIVSFMTNLFVAQANDTVAGSLQADGATGGPAALAEQTSAFNSGPSALFSTWANLTGSDANNQKASIYRGEVLFHTDRILIDKVPGFTDQPGQTFDFSGACSNCHDNQNVGNRSIADPMNTGVSSVSSGLNQGSLSVDYLPTITLENNATLEIVQTTDPGLAMITGKWADVGKMKVPILRGLAARAPYFHNGSAQTLDEVLDFYVNRFGLFLSTQDRADLIAFLNSL
jgi:cytochrome c peroxidase